MENSHIYVSDSDRQYILAKDDIIKIWFSFYYHNK